MSQRTMEAHYQPNWNLTQAHGLAAYNCGYAESPGCGAFAGYQKALVWRLLGNTAIDADSTVLDVGCGIGGPVRWIYERYHPSQTIGLEYLRSSVTAAHRDNARGADRMSFIQGDAHHLPLTDASVDVILNLESALHYADKRAFLVECHRILKPNGTLCLGDITTNAKSFFAPVRWLNALPSQFNCNVHLWSRSDYTDAFSETGFDVAWHEEASQPIATSLAEGRAEMRKLGWWASRGFRGRRVLLALIESQLRSRALTYDLFAVKRR